jgi:translocation and assembly module TamA
MRRAGWRTPFWVRVLACAVMAGPCLVLSVPALAFEWSDLDFFGLFGDKPTAPNLKTLPYKIEFDVADAPSDLTQALKDASILYRLRTDAPADGQTLVRRAQTDLAPLLDAMWGAGYYNGTVALDVAGVPVRADGGVGTVGSSAARAAESFRNRAPVPVSIKAAPGELFRFRTIVFTDGSGRPFTPEELPRRAIKIKPGDPARSADIRVAQAAIVDYFRAQSYPLAKATTIRPIVYHPQRAMDVTIAVDPGPKAPFGEVSVSGKSDVDPAVVRSHIYVEPGDPYSPEAVAEIRKSVLQLPAISSVRVHEPERLDRKGQLPVDVEVADRPLRVVGFSARYSTLDGPALHTYWQHRNLFGGGESLRLEGDIFVPPRFNTSFMDTVKDFHPSDLGGRARISYVKPALGGSRNDLLLDGMFERDRTGGDRFGGYEAQRVQVDAVIRHRFNRTFTAQIGVRGEVGETKDTLGEVDYHLIGMPMAVTYDSTDKLLDPTKGWRVTASTTPYPGFLGSSVGIWESRIGASTYYSLDDSDRIILAGRIGLGSVTGAPLAEIPATHRFYAGGGNSVRGYRYRSLSPLGPTGEVIGGRSLLEASFETRFKITDSIGVVPFFDIGGAYDNSVPNLSSFQDFQDELHYAAGLGFRYYTAIGPIRVDAAVPLNKREGDRSFAIYVGIGQAF